MTNLRNFIGLFLVSLLCFTACKKDNVTPQTADSQTPETINSPTIDLATQTRAMAAVASMANARNGNNLDTLENDCGCYDLFDGIDLDAPHAEVEAAIEAALENLTEAEIIRLFEPVCTDDGEIYESACIADCEGITNYHVCSKEELEDYFFGDFDCEDLDNLTFPAEIELPDGTTITVNSEEELFDLIEKWYEENDDFDYEGEWEDVDYDEDYEECFTIVYPISVQFPDGEIIIYDSEEALYTGIDAWYDLNPDTENDPAPVYPFDVILADSTTQTVSSETDEEALWEACYGDLDFDICFDINFPINLVYPDGSTLAVGSYDELEEAVDVYYEANKDSEEDVDVQYPVDITLTDGTVQTLENEDALDAALEACFDDTDFGKIANKSRHSALSAKRVAKGRVLSGSID